MNLAHRLFKFIWNQTWVGLKYKKTVYKKLCNYGDVPDAPFTQDFFGLLYQGNLNNSVEFSIYFLGAFEKPLLFFLRDTMLQLRQEAAKSPVNFFDVGANTGQHSLFMSLHADQVHSFEPYKTVSEQLRRHIELNKIDNIQLHPIGLGNKNQQLDFFAPTGHNQGIGSFDAGTVSKGNVNLGKLELLRGDDYLQQRELQDLALLKIDVEGFEKNVLVGLQGTLYSARPIIVVEVSYGNALSFPSLDDLRAVLPANYSLFLFDNRKADGSKARRRSTRAKRSGIYKLVPFSKWRNDGQDDIIACPNEKLGLLPRQNLS